MRIRPAEEIPFEDDEGGGDDLDAVVALVAALATPGAGWLNLLPEVDPELEPPPRGVLAAIFSARGPAVPLATVTAPESPGGALTVGLEHGAGPKALDRLEERGRPRPDGWRKLADHPRRGLVLAVPASTDPAELLRWLLDAARLLSPVPLTGSWLARAYRPGR